MMDMTFVHKNKLYIYYNKMPAKEYKVSLTGTAELCYSQEELLPGTIFDDFSMLSSDQIENGGSKNV